ncbi:MAG: hypothetical protein JST04_01805 [Bdellovibrionales bacterium]|nr:hypothetical protein [Bdellovibrionales bacterium]
MWTLSAPFPGIARLSSILLAGLALGLSGCSLSSSNGDSSIYVDLSNLQGGSRFSLLDSSGPAYGLGAPPPTTSGFQCFAVNVTGPGIGDSSPNPHLGIELGPIFDRLLSKQSYCSYRGVVSPTISRATVDAGAGSAALQVPPGGVRLVQITGVNDPLVCAAGVINDPPGSVSGNRYFEVGRAVLNDVFGDRSVDVAMDWPATAAEQSARMMDCGDGTCGTLSGVDSTGAAASTPVYQYPNPSPSVFNSLAFKVNAPFGKRMMKLTILLSSPLAANTAVVELRKNTGTAPSLDLTHGVSVPVTLNVPAGGSATPYTVDLLDAAGNPIVSDGSDYWVFVTAPGATESSPIGIVHNAGTSNGTVYSFNSSSPVGGISVGSTGVVHDLIGCGI